MCIKLSFFVLYVFNFTFFEHILSIFLSFWNRFTLLTSFFIKFPYKALSFQAKLFLLRKVLYSTAWKVSRYRVFSGLYFPVFGLNIFSMNIRTRKNSVFGHFSRSVQHVCYSRNDEMWQRLCILCVIITNTNKNGLLPSSKNRPKKHANNTCI